MRKRLTLLMLCVVAGMASLLITQPPSSFAAVDQLHTFTYQIVDAEYSKTLDRLVMVDGAGKVHIFNPNNKNDVVLTLLRPGTDVSISPNGLWAAIGQDAKVTLIDLSAASITEVFSVPAIVTDLVLTDNGFVYALGHTTWAGIYTLNTATGEVNVTNFFDTGLIRLHPAQNRIYYATHGTSPDDIGRISLDETGAVTGEMDSIYHGYYIMCGNVWPSDDGKLLFTACGSTFTSTEDPGQDMIYNGALAGINAGGYYNYSVGGMIAHSTPADLILGVAANSRKILAWDYSVMAPPASVNNSLDRPQVGVSAIAQKSLPKIQVGEQKYPTNGYYVFFNPNSTGFYALIKTETVQRWGLFMGPLNTWTPVATPVPTSEPPPTPTPSVVLGSFELMSPTHGGVLSEVNGLDFVWEQVTEASSYQLVIQKLSNNAGLRVGTVFDQQISPSYCADGECHFTLATGWDALLTEGQYAWTVFASGGNQQIEAINGAFDFVVRFSEPVELLTNGDIEQAGPSANTPHGWVSKNTSVPTADRVVCGTGGNCVFEFNGNGGGGSSRLTQEISDLSQTLSGAQLRLKARVKANKVPAGTIFAKATVEYTDATQALMILKVPTGATTYKQRSSVLDLQKDAASIRVELSYSRKTGKLTLDDVSLTVIPAPNALTSSTDTLIPVPAAP